MWPYQQLDLGLLASRTVLRHAVCGTLLWQPQEMKTPMNKERYTLEKAVTAEVKSESVQRHKPPGPKWKAMWMGLLNQENPQTDIDGVCKDLSAWHRALRGMKTLEVCLAEPLTAQVLLETKLYLAHWHSHFLSPQHFPFYLFPLPLTWLNLLGERELRLKPKFPCSQGQTVKTLYTSKHAEENSRMVKTQIATALLYSTDVQLTIPSLILRERRCLHSNVGVWARSQKEREAVLWVGLMLQKSSNKHCGQHNIYCHCFDIWMHSRDWYGMGIYYFPLSTRDGPSQSRRATCREEIMEETPLTLATSSWVRI